MLFIVWLSPKGDVLTSKSRSRVQLRFFFLETLRSIIVGNLN